MKTFAIALALVAWAHGSDDQKTPRFETRPTAAATMSSTGGNDD